ncbi:MAG TPA: divalent-cation tolerance protein CutA, partial [Desulfatiglandales bacterium]|nr:divalent-cation tolerance protein CutA [Desulfatiglandales bacterium]
VSASGLDEAKKLANAILAARYAACVTIVPAVESMYWWEGKIEQGEESLLVIKTTADQYAPLEKAIKDMHSYEVPEIVALSVKAGLPQYLEWVVQEVHK